MLRRKLVLCLGIGLIFGAVAVAQKAGQPNYYPMPKGATWTYDMKVGDVTIRQKADVTEVKKTPEGEQATIQWRVNEQVVQKEVYRMTPNALVRLEGGAGAGGKINPPMPILKYPIKSGDKWTWKGTITTPGVTINGTNSISVSGPETIKTAAGTFQKVYRVHGKGTLKLAKMDKSSALPGQSNTRTAAYRQAAPAMPETINFTSDLWLAPGVGPVQQTAIIGPQKLEGKLLSYKLK